MRSPPPCSSLRPMVRHPAHHLEVCILAPTVAGDPRRCHPNVVTNNHQSTLRLKGYGWTNLAIRGPTC